MPVPDRTTYLSEVADVLRRQWPANRTAKTVCVGHELVARELVRWFPAA